MSQSLVANAFIPNHTPPLSMDSISQREPHPRGKEVQVVWLQRVLRAV